MAKAMTQKAYVAAALKKAQAKMSAKGTTKPKKSGKGVSKKSSGSSGS